MMARPTREHLLFAAGEGAAGLGAAFGQEREELSWKMFLVFRICALSLRVNVGDLRIEGELLFYDQHGQLITDPLTTTQSGSDELSTTGAQVLSLMGQRGGWHLDDICTSTGLPASAVGGALFLLELDRRVQRDPTGAINALEADSVASSLRGRGPSCARSTT